MSKDDLDWDNPSTGIFTDYFGTHLVQRTCYTAKLAHEATLDKIWCLIRVLPPEPNAGGNDGGGLDRLADREQGTGTTGEGGLNKRSHGKLA